MRHGGHDSLSSMTSLSHYGHDVGIDAGYRHGGHSDRHRQSRHGDRLGCSRQGRARLEAPLMYPSRRSSMHGGLGVMGGMGGMGGMGEMGGLGGLGAFGGLRGGGGGLFGAGSMQERLQGSQRLSSTSRFPRDGLLDSRRNPYSESNLGLGSRLGSRDRLSDRGPFMSGGLHCGSGSRGSLGSYGSESPYNLHQFDRNPRQYHWQPPHVEDDIEEAMMEEEMYRRQADDMMARGMIPGDDFEGPIFEQDFIDPRHRRGGL